MVFTFGKYAGYALADIPASYLGLAVETFTIPEPLLCQCRAELLRRFGLSGIEPIQAEEVDLRVRIRQTYRELALRYHPDKGGTSEAMQAINDFYQRLTA